MTLDHFASDTDLQRATSDREPGHEPGPAASSAARALRDFYCTPIGDTVLNRYEVWERGGAVGDSVTPSIYCPEYRTHMVLKILSLQRPDEHMFSIGCGNAFVEADLQARGLRVHAIDCNEEAVVLAASKGVAASTADYQALPPGHLAGFSVIYADGLLGHLYQPQTELAGFFEQLRALGPRPGSWLVMSNDAPAPTGPAVVPHGKVQGFWLFSPEYLSDTAQRFGYAVTEAYRFPYERPLSGLRDRTIVIARLARGDTGSSARARRVRAPSHQPSQHARPPQTLGEGNNMDLSEAQVDSFQRDGFLVIERAFSPPETAVLEAALPDITDPSRGHVVFDATSGMVRISHGAHLYNEAIRRLSLHPRLVRPAQRLLDAELHVYQSRLTIKPGMGAVQASGWVWHQDFSTWHRSDGMPEPRALVTFTFLDDVTAANAPLLVIPRSHRGGLLGTIPGKNGEYQNVAITPETVREMGQRDGVVALTGPAGTVVFMSCALVHGSTENISPLRRALFTVVFNPVDNRALHPRSEHWAPTDVVPVRPLPDDCLLTLMS